MDKKSISSTVMCITDENAINSFRSYFHLFKFDYISPTLASIYRMIVVLSITHMEFSLLSF